MKRLSIMIAAATLLAVGPAKATDYKNITVATEGAFAPWNFKDSAGKLVGFEMDLLPNLCKRMEVNCKIVEQAWNGIIPGLQSGKFDAIMAAMSITETRKKAVLFSRPYASVGSTFATAKSNPLAKYKAKTSLITLDRVSAEDQKAIDDVIAALKGKVLGVNRATTNESFAKAFLSGKGIDIRTYDIAQDLDLDLSAGRVDAAVVLRAHLKVVMDSPNGKDIVQFGPNFIGGPFGAGTGVAVRKDDQKLADMFSKAINEALADGTIKKLTEKWFGYDASPQS